MIDPNTTSHTAVFIPKDNASPEENLRNYIDTYRNESTIFGKDLPFDENVWDLSETIKNVGRLTASRVNFGTYEFAKMNGSKAIHADKMEAFQEPFLSFAKAYFRARYGKRAFKSISRLTSVLRALEKALRDTKHCSDVTHLDAQVFDAAAQIIRNDYSNTGAYSRGNNLQAIAAELNDKQLTLVPIDWVNPFTRPNRDEIKVGAEADRKRIDKMPSQAALDALPEMFNKAETPYEEIFTSQIAILMCQPARINELAYLPFFCEVEEKLTGTNDNKNGGSEVRYSLRWAGSKGSHDTIKPIPKSMEDVARKAVARLRKYALPAREVALWYEKHPNKLYLPEHLEHLRDRPLRNIDIGRIIYGDDFCNAYPEKVKQGVRNLIYKKKSRIPTEHIVGEKNPLHGKKPIYLIVQFADLQNALMKNLLPEGFPYVPGGNGVKYSDLLCISLKYQTNRSKPAQQYSFEWITSNMLQNSLRKSQPKRDSKSIFEYFGYTEPDGSQIDITTHSFRHWLNTLAQIGGLSEIMIARWSNRKDLDQNNAYNHVTADFLIEKVNNALSDTSSLTSAYSDIDVPKRQRIISRDEYGKLAIKTAHITEIGVCIHDFAMTPCELHMDCLNCNESFCMKGDKERNDRIFFQRDETRMLLEKALKAEQEGHVGATRWVERQKLVVERLDKLCDFLGDPNVPDGAIMQLSNLTDQNGDGPSRIDHSIDIKTDEKKEEIDQDGLKNFLNDLGGFNE